MRAGITWLLALGLAGLSCSAVEGQGAQACQRATCEELDLYCGTVDDGCGGTLECGTCPTGQLCGAYGEAGRCGTPLAPQCVEEDLRDALPLNTRGIIFGAGAEAAPLGSCATAQSVAKRSFQWTAPRTGRFVIDTAGSSMDTFLSVRRGDCNGPELACDADGLRPTNASVVTVPLLAGERVLIVVHGPGPRASFAKGSYQLHIREQADTEAGACGDGADNDGNGQADCMDPACSATAECGAQACGWVNLGSDVPTHLSGTTAGGGNALVSSCGHMGAQERTHTFTAPRTGTFVATVNGATTLFVRSACGGEDLACRFKGLSDPHAVSVPLTLTQGESVVIAVESVKDAPSGPTGDEVGSYTLDITELTGSEVGLCGDRIDNDADFLQDCDDSDCARDEGCPGR